MSLGSGDRTPSVMSSVLCERLSKTGVVGMVGGELPSEISRALLKEQMADARVVATVTSSIMFWR